MACSMPLHTTPARALPPILRFETFFARVGGVQRFSLGTFSDFSDLSDLCDATAGSVPLQSG